MVRPVKKEIANPLIIMFQENGKTITHLYPSEEWCTHEHYGILIADIVRHVANKFKVHEGEVWDWVDKERYSPTDTPTELSE